VARHCHGNIRAVFDRTLYIDEPLSFVLPLFDIVGMDGQQNSSTFFMNILLASQSQRYS